MTVIIDGTSGINTPGVVNTAAETIATTLTVTGASTLQGLTVGRGAGAVSTNTAVGASALGGGSQTGTNNVAVGYTVMGLNTSGGANTGVGDRALENNTTGSFNSGFGVFALRANTTGQYNTGYGAYALTANTTASNNTAVGYQAGYSNTTAVGNTFIGSQAALLNTTGTYNIAIGVTAGPVISNGTGTGNVSIGVGAGASLSSGAYNTFVGAAGQVNQGPGGLVTTGSKNTIIGAYNGNQGGLDIRTANNYIVLSDGDGNPLVTTANSQTVALKGAVPNSGTGITFPATQSASSNPNTLDDYEEGTWTPSFSTGTFATQNNFTYTKIGRTVFITGYLASPSGLPTVGVLTISGLPFSGSGNYQMSLLWYDGSSSTIAAAYLPDGSSALQVRPIGGGPSTFTELSVQMTYIT